MAIYNRIFTEEKWDLVNKDNKNLLKDYMIELKSNKKKKGTIDQYHNDIRIIFIYILDELDNKPIYKLKRKQFRNFMLWLIEDKKMSAARANRIFSALRTMLEYASNDEEWEDDFEINEAAKVKGIRKEVVRDIVFLTDEEIEYLYNNLMERKKYQQAAYLSIMYDSAGRRNEVYQVTKTGLPENNFTNIVEGKRGKKFPLLLNTRSKEAITKLLEERGEDNLDTLWVTNGKQTSYETLYYWVVSWRKILKEKFEEEKLFNPHSFRHSALENYENGTHYKARELNKKFSLQELKILAHHEDVSTTESYLKNKDDDLLLEAFGIN